MAAQHSSSFVSSSPSKGPDAADPLAWFQAMVPHCREFAQSAEAKGHPIIGILCEYAPRELILAAGGVPVCLCGGDPDTIPSAEVHLPANLCPLVKSTYGYLLDKSNPFLEMADLLVAETTCDGKKKMFELMGDSKPTYLIELPQQENDPEAPARWEAQLHKFKAFLENRYQATITREKLCAAIAMMNRERFLRRQLAQLMKSETPPLTGRQLLDLKSIISCIPADLEHYEAALRQFSEVPEPISVRRRPVRVLLTGVPMVHGAERVMEIIECHGGLVVCQENCTGLKPILEDVVVDGSDPMRALAQKYYHLPCSVMTRNERRLDSLRQLALEYRAECVIELIWQACLTYAIEAQRVRRVAEDELALPYLRIETDYSPSDSARIAVRVEALMEMVQNRRSISAPEVWSPTR
jgi:benzoyl-CoA reductase/2-hydroxyglutaryl-CoA dehydratase subunit BcrC/BadD/HgdB